MQRCRAPTHIHGSWAAHAASVPHAQQCPPPSRAASVGWGGQAAGQLCGQTRHLLPWFPPPQLHHAPAAEATIAQAALGHTAAAPRMNAPTPGPPTPARMPPTRLVTPTAAPRLSYRLPAAAVAAAGGVAAAPGSPGKGHAAAAAAAGGAAGCAAGGAAVLAAAAPALVGASQAGESTPAHPP
eukprot:364169-Chlamydomonas_euryale.AAC.1